MAINDATEVLSKIDEWLQNIRDCVRWKDEFASFIKDDLSDINMSDIYNNIIISNKSDIALSDISPLKELFTHLFVYKRYDFIFAECSHIYSQHYSNVNEQYLILKKHLSRNFLSKMFLKSDIARLTQSLNEFIESDAYASVKQYYVELDSDREYTNDMLLDAYKSNKLDWENIITKYINNNVSGELSDLHKQANYCRKIFCTDYSNVLDNEIESYRYDLNITIKKVSVKTKYQQLEALSIDELRKDKSGLRISALSKNGFRTLADIYRVSVAELSSIKGISNDNAYAIKLKVDDIFNKLSDQESSLSISYDNRTPAMSELIQKVYNARRYLTVRKKFNTFCETILSDTSTVAAVCDFINSLSSDILWLFKDDEYKSKFSLMREFLQSLHNDPEFCELEKYVKFEEKYRLDKWHNVSADLAWADFRDNNVAYLNCIEYFVPDAFGKSDDTYGLSEELAEAIESECIYPDGLLIELRRYQVWGVKFALHQCRILLGDEMGLGKTIQAIATMVSLRNVGMKYFIVICPASVLLNWYREIKQCSKLQAYPAHGKDRDNITKSWMCYGGVLITTYETYSSLPISDLKDIGLVVVDEAHYIKNEKAKRSISIRGLCSQVGRVIFMTGTALENRVDEMISLLSCLNEKVANEAQVYKDISSESFKKAVMPVYFRRKQIDVNKELPERVDNIIWSELCQEELIAYEKALCSSENPFMPARQVSWNVSDLKYSSKAASLKQIVEDVENDGRKVIVFSFFKNTISRVKQLFEGKCSDIIDGSISPARRQEIIDEFTNSEKMTVLVSQIQAGGTGLNIQAASVVVLCEPQIKPSIEDQAIARAHRMGQSRNVLVYRLCCADTIDERMLDLLSQKRIQFQTFADQSLSGDESLSLTNGDIKNILIDEIKRIKESHGNFNNASSFKYSVEGKAYMNQQKSKMAQMRRIADTKDTKRVADPAQRMRILRRDNFKCCLCGRVGEGYRDEQGRTPAELGLETYQLEIDHKTPYSRGGQTTDDNLWTLCRICNQGKSDNYDDANM